ncbi:MAG: hypothetical protein IPO27_08370 [Bacteroidetes bacterium]|nr:hypothetical protein [Bacteroidota bacterium]
MNKSKFIIMLLVLASAGSSYAQWSLTGNAGTTPGTNFIGTTDNKALQLRTNNQTRLSITSAGKVGIGNNAPTYRLDVNGDGRINTTPQNVLYPSLILSSTPTVANYTLYEPLQLQNKAFFAGQHVGIGFYNGGIASAKIKSVLNGGNDYALQFDVADGNSVMQTRMYINVNGNVGIGSTSPISKLSVHTPTEDFGIIHTDENVRIGTFIGAGVAGAQGGYFGTTTAHPLYFHTGNNWPQLSLLVNGNFGIGTETPHAQLQLGNLLTNRRIVLWESVDNEHQFAGFGMNANTLRYQVEGTGGSHVFYAATSATSSNELMRIQGDGRVAIGGSASNNYKLTVRGSVICTDLRVQLQPFPDYVFASDYKMLPLNELENYVTTNNHLPGMPTAAEVDELEVTVGQLQMKLVEKVEELTLYLIELNKKNEQLKGDNAALLERVKVLEQK